MKIHNETGLKYLGCTIKKDPYKYKGSGKYWLKHLREHGNNFTTTVLLATENFEDARGTAKFFSKIFNIVKSSEWANTRIESANKLRTLPGIKSSPEKLSLWTTTKTRHYMRKRK